MPDGAGLDPHRSRIRLVQLYGGGKRAAVIDLDHVPLSVCDALWERPLLIHNAAFELGFLEMAGIRPAQVSCTMQAAGLVFGVHRRSLAEAAHTCLGLDISKVEQLSDWTAPVLRPRSLTMPPSMPCWRAGLVTSFYQCGRSCCLPTKYKWPLCRRSRAWSWLVLDSTPRLTQPSSPS